MENLNELKKEELKMVDGGSWYPWEYASEVLAAYRLKWQMEDDAESFANGTKVIRS